MCHSTHVTLVSKSQLCYTVLAYLEHFFSNVAILENVVSFGGSPPGTPVYLVNIYFNSLLVWLWGKVYIYKQEPKKSEDQHHDPSLGMKIQNCP